MPFPFVFSHLYRKISSLMQLFQPLNIYREIRALVLHWPGIFRVSLTVLGVMNKLFLQGAFGSNPNGNDPFAICAFF